MRVKLIATATDLSHQGLQMLKKSLDLFGWDYEILTGKYLAYGSKMVNAYNYAKQTDCTHLFIVDGYDIVVLGTMGEALQKVGHLDCILFNSEKGCWPYPEWAERYPAVNSDWKYLNGGACFVKTDLFVRMFEGNPIDHKDNDQVNLADIYLNNRDRYNMRLDTGCEAFQSIAFERPGDFKYEGNRLINSKLNTLPVIIHGNGKTDMSRIYALINNQV
jgi:hypothetical protein